MPPQMKTLNTRPPDDVCLKIYFLTQTSVVGTQKNRLNETVLWVPKHV